MPSAGFEPVIPEIKRPQTHDLDCNMYRKAINILRKFVHQVGSVYKLVSVFAVSCVGNDLSDELITDTERAYRECLCLIQNP